MKQTHTIFPAAARALAVLVCIVVLSARAAHAAGANDVARFLAGLPVAPTSQLAPAMATPGWQRHAGEMSAAWRTLERQQLNRVRVWAAAKLPPPRPAMFYMFGGPDFVHAEALFPHASVYVLAGLEPVGAVPDIATLPPHVLDQSLAALRQSLTNFLTYGYFITKEMGTQLRAGAFTGTLPLLSMFLARSGKAIREVTPVALRANGDAVPVRGKGGSSGVKIVFSGRDGRPRTLYYFSTNLENAGVAKSGFLKFCARLGEGGSLVKSASYLMHLGNFSKVRDFLLARSAVIVQDDSGIPLKYFSPARWRLRAYGQYLTPIEVFKRHYQPDLAQLFASGAQRVNFGIGYRWHPTRTNILLAERLGAQ